MSDEPDNELPLFPDAELPAIDRAKLKDVLSKPTLSQSLSTWRQQAGNRGGVFSPDADPEQTEINHE